jgi:diguanylate cyclase (GGDEF)-like protein
VSVLFVDLDDCKAVNDSLGHAVGDDLLAAVSARLVACMRAGDTVARLGGDEFAVLIEGADERAAVQTAERLISALGMPLALPGTTVTVRASIGIAVTPPGTGDAGEVLRNADVAMYAAKEAGKGRLAVFEPGMHTRALDPIEQEHDLREAIAQDQFVLHYQPVAELASGRMVGAEALVRWRHPPGACSRRASSSRWPRPPASSSTWDSPSSTRPAARRCAGGRAPTCGWASTSRPGSSPTRA